MKGQDERAANGGKRRRRPAAEGLPPAPSGVSGAVLEVLLRSSSWMSTSTCEREAGCIRGSSRRALDRAAACGWIEHRAATRQGKGNPRSCEWKVSKLGRRQLPEHIERCPPLRADQRAGQKDLKRRRMLSSQSEQVFRLMLDGPPIQRAADVARAAGLARGTTQDILEVAEARGWAAKQISGNDMLGWSLTTEGKREISLALERGSMLEPPPIPSMLSTLQLLLQDNGSGLTVQQMQARTGIPHASHYHAVMRMAKLGWTEGIKHGRGQVALHRATEIGRQEGAAWLERQQEREEKEPRCRSGRGSS